MENVSDSVKSSPDKIVEKTDELQRALLDKIGASVDVTSAGLSHIAEVFAKLEGSFKEEINALRETLQKVFEEMYMQFKASSEGLQKLSVLVEKYVGDFKEEREKFDRKMRKEDSRRLNDMAVRNYYAGKLDTAIRQLKEAVLLDEEATEPLTNLGIALSKKGMQKEARKIFDRVLKINPDVLEAKVGLGMIMFDRGNVDEAIEIFKEASKKSGQEAFVYADLGYAYEQKEMIDKAVSNWEMALELDPTLKDVGEKLKLYKDKEA
jgi:tetratricopeptide (TPR) repeat protein